MTYQVETRCLRREPPIVELSVQAGAFLDYDPVLYVLPDFGAPFQNTQ